MTNTQQDGLLWAFELDSAGGGAPRTWAELDAWKAGQGALWVHLAAMEQESVDWLREASGLDGATCDALLEEATRPGCRVLEDGGLLVILRGVNLNPGADPEDMVALRLWIDGARVLSLSRRRLMAVSDVAHAIQSGRGPHNALDILTSLTDALLDRMQPVLNALEDAVDAQEEEAIQAATLEQQNQIAELRQQVFRLRRHLAPQRDALLRLAEAVRQRFDEDHAALVQNQSEKVIRHVEELELLRDRVAVIHDLLAGRQADRLNQKMMMLSVVTAIFLPLGFVTGLLGINVGGVPGVENEMGFALVCALLLVLGLLTLELLRRMKLL